MSEVTSRQERFESYLEKLAVAVGRKNRREPLRGYCTGLLLPGERKSMEPMAARLDPTRVQARHQSLQNFVSQSAWDDDAVMLAARQCALPAMQEHGGIEAWMVDDTGYPKQGKHSVGVARQYCGMVGKTANCQVAVTTSVANDWASLPVAHRLYLPEKWATDPERRKKAGVPEDVVFTKKWEIALAQITTLQAEGVPTGIVLADAGYGDASGFREGLTALGLRYTVGICGTTSVWRPGEAPLPPAERGARGRPQKRVRRDEEHQPVAAKVLGMTLPMSAWSDVTWREGTQGGMTSRFARVRVRPGHRDYYRTEPRDEEWLLIEWPVTEKEPTRYWLSTEPADIEFAVLIRRAKLRWRIERDYEELKQELGFAHFEGRSWRGFHHHSSLCIAAYAFLMAERARLSPPGASRKSPVEAPPVPAGFRPRGAAHPR